MQMRIPSEKKTEISFVFVVFKVFWNFGCLYTFWKGDFMTKLLCYSYAICSVITKAPFFVVCCVLLMMMTAQDVGNVTRQHRIRSATRRWCLTPARSPRSSHIRVHSQAFSVLGVSHHLRRRYQSSVNTMWRISIFSKCWEKAVSAR